MNTIEILASLAAVAAVAGPLAYLGMRRRKVAPPEPTGNYYGNKLANPWTPELEDCLAATPVPQLDRRLTHARNRVEFAKKTLADELKAKRGGIGKARRMLEASQNVVLKLEAQALGKQFAWTDGDPK